MLSFFIFQLLDEVEEAVRKVLRRPDIDKTFSFLDSVRDLTILAEEHVWRTFMLAPIKPGRSSLLLLSLKIESQFDGLQSSLFDVKNELVNISISIVCYEKSCNKILLELSDTRYFGS
jgi:hypothetical protein